MAFSLKALVPMWMFVMLFAHSTIAQEVSTQAGHSAASASVPSLAPTKSVMVSVPDTTVETVSASASIPPQSASLSPIDISSSNESSVPPSYVLKYESGQPCLLATFNLTIRVSYYVSGSKTERKYVAFKDVKVPDLPDTFDSVCGENQSSLMLEWGNSTFNLNMTFVSHGKSENGQHTNWTLDSIEFGYNLSNFIVFPASSSDEYVTVETEDMELFNTVIGHSKECNEPFKTKLNDGGMTPILTFDYVKLAAFNLTSETFPEEVEECLVKSNSFREEDIMVPLIIACALSAVIIVVVIAYAISRKVQEARDQSQYKPMP